MPSPNGTGTNVLTGVAGDVPEDAWAVGFGGSGDRLETRALHWDGTAWRPVPGTNRAGLSNQLNAVAANARVDVWAVGSSHGVTGGPQTLLAHWNGQNWTLADPVLPGDLLGVAARAADDAWAVGYTGDYHTLVLHWDGTAWAQVPSPNGGTGNNYLAAVAAREPNDAWAVGGFQAADGARQPLLLHWDGTAWTQVATNLPGELKGVVALAADNAWAVGSTGQPGALETLALHWDGQTWSRVPSPNAGFGENVFTAIAAQGSDDLWAVGRGPALDNTQQSTTLIAHWTGREWGLEFQRGPAALRGVAAFGGTDLWAVGYAGMVGAYSTLVLHHGNLCEPPPITSTPEATSTREPSPTRGTPEPTSTREPPPSGTPGPRERLLVLEPRLQISFAQRDTMHVFSYALHSRLRAAVQVDLEALSIFTWTTTLTPTRVLVAPGTPVPVHLTVSVPASSTHPIDLEIVTATDGPHSARAYSVLLTGPPRTFGDLDAQHWSYNAVQYLATQGIVSGYRDGTFRPNNNVTRAQFAKMLVTGLGWTLITPAQPRFSDVPLTDWAYSYIETAAAHGAISGYRDGTFRPYADVTRAQLAKLIVAARGWAAVPPAQATFRDVPAGDWAYAYVETAVDSGVLSGYADGTFRPSAAATRAQVAKILAGGLVLNR